MIRKKNCHLLGRKPILCAFKPQKNLRQMGRSSKSTCNVNGSEVSEVMLGPKAPKKNLRSQKPHLPQWNFKSWKKNSRTIIFSPMIIYIYTYYIYIYIYIYTHHVLVFNSNNFSIMVGHLFFAFVHCQPSDDSDWPWHWTIGPSMIAPNKSPF